MQLVKYILVLDINSLLGRNTTLLLPAESILAAVVSSVVSAPVAYDVPPSHYRVTKLNVRKVSDADLFNSYAMNTSHYTTCTVHRS